MLGMTPVTLHHPIFVVIAALAAVGWLVYLTMTIYEHRKTLAEIRETIK